MSGNARVQVAEAIANELPTRCYMDTTDCLRVADVAIAAHLESLHPVIETVEQLDALPTLAIVRDEWTSAAGWHHSGIWERRGMSWHCIAAPVLPPGHPRPSLPARVLYTPEADRA